MRLGQAPRALPPCARQATSPPSQQPWGRAPAASRPWVRCEVRLLGRDARALERPFARLLLLLLLNNLHPTVRIVRTAESYATVHIPEAWVLPLRPVRRLCS